MTDTTLTTTEAVPSWTNYGGFGDALGGIATMVLAIVALAGVHSDLLLGIATIIFGAALLVHGGAMLSEYTHIIFPPGTTDATSQEFSGGSLAAVFLVGAAGIILGILALLGIFAVALTTIAVIAFGATLVLSSNAVWHLHLLKRSLMMTRTARDYRGGSEILAGEMASGSAMMQAMAGLAAMVLGIIALVGTNSAILTLVALLVLGTTIVLTGGALSGAVLSFMRPSVHPTRSGIYGSGV